MIGSRAASAWRRLWGSIAFRLTLNYSLLAVFTTIFLLIFAYGKIVDVLQTQFSRQVTLTTHRLVNLHHTRGHDALRIEIGQLLSDQTDIDAEMYLLIGAHGRKLAGNLDSFSAHEFIRDPLTPILLDVVRDGAPASGFLAIRRLPDGDTLVVGRDIHDLKEIKKLIGQAVIAATLVALILVLIGTSIFRRELRHRVEAIRETAFRVGTGELTRRIPPAPQDDEFAHLRYDINHMLDQIETLMNGVRNVSDSIAHNVRTPLARVMAKLHKIQNSSHDEAALSEAIESISDEIMSLIGVTEKLLLIAEAESGVRRQTFQSVRLDQVVDDVIDLYEALAREKGNVLMHRRALNHAGLWVLADADLLAGAIANLVENSLKYAGDGASITITTFEHNGRAILTVVDNGPGVDARHLARLGSRFYRVRPDIPGSGLGLASVRAIVTLHGGAIRFRNAKPGLRVDIEFPIIAKR